MKCAASPFGSDPRLVGDPVNVVTGANSDRGLDFRLEGPILLQWFRYYDSGLSRKRRSLGWGHGDAFDRLLRFDLDGIRYQGPDGGETNFPFLERDGDSHSADGLTLVRMEKTVFRIRERMEPDAEFTFHHFDRPALLGRLVQGTHQIVCKYGNDRRLESIIDSAGRWIEIKRDEAARTQTFFLHETLGKPPKPLLGYRFDAAGNLIEAIDAYRNPFSFRYDAANRMISKTDRRGYTFRFEYDASGKCVRSAGEDGVEDVSLKYLGREGLTEVTRGNGGTWSYYLDEKGFLYQIIDPYGGVVSFKTDEEGRLAEEIDPNGNVTKVLYDEAGKPIAKVSPDGSVVAKGEEPPDRAQPRLASRALEFELGDFLYRKAIEPPSWKSGVLEEIPSHLQRHFRILQRPAPAPGEDSATVEAAALATLAPPRIVKDVFGQVSKETAPGRIARAWAYDKNGNVSAYRDSDGAVFRYEYASWNHLIKSTDPVGRETHFAYTDGEKVKAAVGPGGNRSEFSYDLLDRRIASSHHGAPMEECLYDNAGNLIEKRDGSGKSLFTQVIAKGNRIASRRLASGDVHGFAYDENGRCVEASAGNWKGEFAYDVSGYRKADLREGRGVRHAFHGWVLAGTTVLDKFAVTYARKGKNALIITLPGKKVIQIKRLENGMILKTLPNGSKEWSQFDRDGRAISKVASGPERFGQEWVRRYSYSDAGDLLEELDTRYGTIGYRYDAAHRVISETTPIGEDIPYAHDAAGNLIAKPGLWGVSLQTGNRLGTANGDRFDFDDRDNLSLRTDGSGETAYRYDSLGRLTGIARDGDLWWTAEYDPFGRRIRKSVRGKVWEYHWDSDRLASEIDPGGRLRVYVYPDVLALTPLAFVDYDSVEADPAAGKRHFVFSNHLGTPVLIEDDAGTPVWSARVEAYGAAHVNIGDGFHMPLRFPGHYWDAETGLHYNRHRYYSPELGRYLQADPIGIEGGLNLYAYTDGNPLKLVDVLGLKCPEGNDGGDGKPKLTPEEQAAAKAALQRSLDAQEALPKEMRNKTVASDGTMTISGFKMPGPAGFTRRKGVNDAPSMLAHSDAIGHKAIASGGTDQGTPGANSATHAEKQLAVVHQTDGTNAPIGVSREQCGDCRGWFTKQAQDSGTPHTVADPVHTRRYNPDGTVDVFRTDTGEHVMTAAKGQPPQASMTNYEGIPW